MRFRFLRLLAGPLMVLAFCSVLVGCKSGSFVGKRYDNFTAYYNTFYNARRSYRSGVTSRERLEDRIDRTRYLGVFIQQRASPGGGRDFEEAVLKSADVLREHPQSKWVDDALMLIGKSYFYQNNYVGAQQKFREAMDLETGLEEEARFWFARTLVASGDFERAEAAIGESLAEGLSSHRWEASLRLALGELRVKQGAWEAAAVELETGLESVGDSDIAAGAQFLLAQVLETLGRYPEAAAAYSRVMHFNPRYELGFAGQYSAIRVEGRYVDTEAALSKLRRMSRDDKHFSYRAELAVLRGQLEHAAGWADESYNTFHELLYDEAFASQISSLRGVIHYSIAELYRDLDLDFVPAAAHFDTASASLRTGPGLSATPVDPIELAPEAISDATELKLAFGSFASAFREVSRMDSLLWLGSMDDSTFAEKVLDLRRLRADELAEKQRLREERQIARAFQSGATSAGIDNRGLPEGKVIPSRNAEGDLSGFLFHDDPVMLQEGQLTFNQRWGDRPHAPNWRRLDAVRGIDLSEEEALDDEDRELAIDELPEIDISSVPRDSTARADMESLRAVARYDVGNALFIGIDRPDSAAVWYRMVLEETPDEPVAQRALYAMAEIQQALGDSLAARGLYRNIVEAHPESEFATRARAVLGMESVDQAAPDSSLLAEMAYQQHFESWQRQEMHTAMNGMFEMAGLFNTTSLVPRALYAAGSIFLEWADSDSLDVYAPMPIEVPDSLLIAAGLIIRPISEDSLSLAADSLLPGELSDSLAVQPGLSDSLRAAGGLPSDSLLVSPSDSSSFSASSDSLRVVSVAVDSLDAIRGDSLLVPAGGDGSLVAPGLAVADSLSGEGLAATDSLTASLSPTDSLSLPIEPEIPVDPDAWKKVRVKDLMDHLSVKYSATRYGIAARAVLGAFGEIESEKEAIIADSIALADSVMLALQELEQADSLALAVVSDSLALPAASDSVATAGLAQAEIVVDSVGTQTGSEVLPAAIADSLAGRPTGGAADSSLVANGAGLERSGPDKGKRAAFVPVRDSLEVSESGRAVLGMVGGRDIVAPAAGNLRTAQRTDLTPLASSEEEAEAWSGWTLVLSEQSDLREVGPVRAHFSGLLNELGQTEVWSQSGDRPGYMITIGRLASLDEARLLAERLGTDLPQDAWLLQIIVE